LLPELGAPDDEDHLLGLSLVERLAIPIAENGVGAASSSSNS
jgi:hypothetical protein